MLSHNDIMSTIDMIDHQHLDIRTITLGLSLLDCADPNAERCAQKIYDKICRHAEKLVPTVFTTRSPARRKILSARAKISSGISAFPSSISAFPSLPSPW